MISIILCYIFFAFILITYGAKVCPFLEGLGYLQASIHTYVPVLLVPPIRILLFKKNISRIDGSDWVYERMFG
ncbi:MAG: hypothetical protein JSW15_12755 [Deltaproteobacteria bacterium]|nr:MAG: hypothetical protein JSW15_12755 [Deltaproteobacteria bacterium]